MIRAGGAAAEARLERELQEAEEKRIREKKKLDEMGGLQRRASRLANSDTFGRLSIAAISAFSILLAFARPLEPPDSERNSSISFAENVFTIIFTVEVAIVWVAAGPIGFFRDKWNIFDFLIVGIGWLAFTPIETDLAVLRVARLLRPLRSLNRCAPLALPRPLALLARQQQEADRWRCWAPAWRASSV